MKKNNIGIMTFHDAINYGAALQTYALNKYINNLNYNCETIDYKCDYIENSYKILNINIKDIKGTANSILNVLNNVIRKNKFNKFLKNNVKISQLKYNSNNIWQSNSKYNTFIVGSDQVWNIDLCADFNYFLPFVNSKNERVSFAASFGDINIINRNGKIIKKELEKYKKISIRELSSVNRLKEELQITAENVLDPVFLLDKKEWLKVANKKAENQKYILLYILHEESAYKIADKISNETGLNILIITQSRKKRINGKYIRNAGPEEFISLIANSEYVITDSFHGTALSIIFGKNLKVVLKKENLFLNERLMSILNLFNLEECIVNEESSIADLLQTTDYKDKEENINSEIEKTKKFISDVI